MEVSLCSTVAICISHLLIIDYRDEQHPEILAPAAASSAGSLNSHRNLRPFIFVAGSAPAIFWNQLELVQALSHVLRGLVGHSLSCIQLRLFSQLYMLKQAYITHRQQKADTTDGKQRWQRKGSHSSFLHYKLKFKYILSVLKWRRAWLSLQQMQKQGCTCFQHFACFIKINSCRKRISGLQSSDTCLQDRRGHKFSTTQECQGG